MYQRVPTCYFASPFGDQTVTFGLMLQSSSNEGLESPALKGALPDDWLDIPFCLPSVSSSKHSDLRRWTSLSHKTTGKERRPLDASPVEPSWPVKGGIRSLGFFPTPLFVSWFQQDCMVHGNHVLAVCCLKQKAILYLKLLQNFHVLVTTVFSSSGRQVQLSNPGVFKNMFDVGMFGIAVFRGLMQ